MAFITCQNLPPGYGGRPVSGFDPAAWENTLRRRETQRHERHF